MWRIRCSLAICSSGISALCLKGCLVVFSSTVFLFAFFPLFLAAYFAMPWRPVRNVTLLAFSLVFYAWGEPVYVWLMVGSILVNWALALGIGKFAHGGGA